MDKTFIAVVCGPTASGKTNLGIEIAKEFDGEIVSADSMQIYRRMDIGTAKPTESERAAAVHHMIDIIEPWEGFSVAQYCAMAHEVIDDIASRGKLPVIVGGTGLYIDNLVESTDFSSPEADLDLRRFLTEFTEKNGADALHKMLEECDPLAAARIHPNDVKRTIRAIEAFRSSGKTSEERDRASRRESRYEPVWFMIDYPRETLYERINKRVDIMFSDGLVSEVREVIYPIRDRCPTASAAIGYKEVLRYLDGEESLDETIETVKRETRRYAKRQLTWFRRNSEINLLDAPNAADQANDIISRGIKLWKNR